MENESYKLIIYSTTLEDAYACNAWEPTIKEIFNAFFLCVRSIELSGKALHS